MLLLLVVLSAMTALSHMDCAADLTGPPYAHSAPAERLYPDQVPELAVGAWRESGIVRFALLQVTDGAFEWRPEGDRGWRFVLSLSTKRGSGEWNYAISPVVAPRGGGWNASDSTAAVFFGQDQSVRARVRVVPRGRVITIDLPFIAVQDDGWLDWRVTTYAGRLSAEQYSGGSRIGAPPNWARISTHRGHR